MPTQLTFTQQRGFTLLEIILVLFLLALMASSTLFLTENIEDQAKYDVTKQRLTMIRSAIIGDSSRLVNGRSQISGFVADMGRLPQCLRELLSPMDCDNNELNLWRQDAQSYVWAGWRGPYLAGSSELTGKFHFRDGYGNSGDTTDEFGEDWQNSGWDFSIDSGSLSVGSRGFNGLDNDDVPKPSAAQELVTPFDYQLPFGSDWQDVAVKFHSESTSGTFIPANSLRLKLNSPTDGAIPDYNDSDFDTADKRDGSTVFSRSFPESDIFTPSLNGRFSVASGDELKFSANATVELDKVSITIDSSTTVTFTDSDGNAGDLSLNNSCSPTCVLTLSEEATPGTITSVTFSANGTVSISPDHIAPINAPNFAKPIITVPLDTELMNNTLSLPSGAIITLQDSNSTMVDRNVILSGATITVSQSFTRTSDNTITLDTSNEEITLPSNTPAAVGNTLTIPAASVFPLGEKAFTVVCETGTEKGQLFNGDCDDNTANNISRPHSISLVPRTTLPINGAAIEWTIQ
ncbi:type II secretion system protein [Psychrobium sp. 1_MG-2023]|uniref:type II secretion system protein n=1 Tax=Psychrobium sp. 1_MG-2023 TaxID=3062624 RepID=UPI000C31D7EB|nr:prepilin-type N-terminal cleavage/methylation domain-containing protein [Psychrobium sp. 1_MG-2023]MDP2561781.1 prepilin-type N-terminal cleavage/methylation domain-containing protein [Psychrobium sp. 1_MG-2023]PKF59735.1 hypothetical protein CW748_00605 [Alteromonadales bacterium alter-6D02]